MKMCSLREGNKLYFSHSELCLLAIQRRDHDFNVTKKQAWNGEFDLQVVCIPMIITFAFLGEMT